MNQFADPNIKRFVRAMLAVLAVFSLTAACLIWRYHRPWLVPSLVFFALLAAAVLTVCVRYIHRQHRILEQAASQIQAYLDGNTDARIDCNSEGELYRLFHTVNTLAAVLNAHTADALREKEFLKRTIADISHQLKTPLAALNIYNGLLQDEAETLPEIKEFAELSERELDRMETLVQNLLKLTKLDAHAIVMQMHTENLTDMLHDIQQHFAYRAEQEGKTLALCGAEELSLRCDRGWLIEALENIVKNALDHTQSGDRIAIEWGRFAGLIQIKISDTGVGIHPEDLHHIFKRFYRSKFSKDTPGAGLGLPLAKAIVEAHNGTIEVDSTRGVGTTFIINILIPTKL